MLTTKHLVHTIHLDKPSAYYLSCCNKVVEINQEITIGACYVIIHLQGATVDIDIHILI